MLSLLQHAPANARQPLTDVLARLLVGGTTPSSVGDETVIVPSNGDMVLAPTAAVPPLSLNLRSGGDLETRDTSLLITVRSSRANQAEITSVRLARHDGHVSFR